MSYVSIGLDLAALAIVVWCARAAAKKGFLRTVLQMVAYVVILAVAAAVSKAAAPILYDRVVEPWLLGQSAQEEPASRRDADLVYAGPEGILSLAEDLLGAAGELGQRAEDLLEEGLDQEGLQELTGAALRPLAVNAIRMVAFAVLFVGLSIVANLALSTLGLVNYLPVVGPINALLGLLVGVLQGLLLVWILGLLLQGLLQLYPAGFWVFDPGVIDRTWVFRYIAHPGLLGGLG